MIEEVDLVRNILFGIELLRVRVRRILVHRVLNGDHLLVAARAALCDVLADKKPHHSWLGDERYFEVDGKVRLPELAGVERCRSSALAVAGDRLKGHDHLRKFPPAHLKEDSVEVSEVAGVFLCDPHRHFA